MRLRDAHVMWLQIFVSGAKKLGYDKETFLRHILVAWDVLPSQETTGNK